MRYKEFGIELTLTEDAIDRCSERIAEFLAELKTEKKELVRIRLAAEAVLLKWQEKFGHSVTVRLSCFSHFGQPTIQLFLRDEPFDPLTEEEDGGMWSRKLLAGLQTMPMYQYSKNTNVVTFKLIRKRLSPLFFLLIALAAAAIVGPLGHLLPPDFRLVVADGVLSPICTAFISILGFAGIPLIFLSVVLGICGIGDASSFGRIGSRMIGHFLLTSFLATVIAALLAFPFFSFSFGSGGMQIDYGEFLSMILGFFPTNLVAPFLERNAMQLIIMGMAFGIAILKLDPIIKTLSSALEDLNSILLMISQWLTRLIPFFVFAIIVKSIWVGELGQVIDTWKPWVITTGLQLIVLLLMVLQICARHKTNPFTILRKIFVTFLIAFGTNSCTATIPEIYACSGKLGVSPKLIGFGVPIGTSIFKPSTAVRFVVLSYFMAVAENVEVSPKWFLMVVLMSFLFSVAVPAIPGGALLFYPMLFTQLGLPTEAITAMLATDIFFDATCTAFCQVSAELALVQQSGRMKLLDEAALRKRSA